MERSKTGMSCTATRAAFRWHAKSGGPPENRRGTELTCCGGGKRQNEACIREGPPLHGQDVLEPLAATDHA